MSLHHVCVSDYIKKYRNFNHETATFKLLGSSIFVALSGAFRVYLASILLQTNSSILTCFAGGLIIYSVYVLDRALDSQEDSINRTELNGSNKKVGLAVSLLAFIMGTYILAKDGMFILAFIPFITGYLYSKGIKIGKFALKLKGGLGIKNIVVGLTWGIFIIGLADSTCKNYIPMILVFILYGVKVFINSAIDDFKDIEGDTLAGIKTLPVCLGARKTRTLLMGLHIISHLILGIALIRGMIAFEPLVVGYSFICGVVCVQKYTKSDYSASQKLWMGFFKDGESSMTIILRAIVNMVLV